MSSDAAFSPAAPAIREVDDRPAPLLSTKASVRNVQARTAVPAPSVSEEGGQIASPSAGATEERVAFQAAGQAAGFPGPAAQVHPRSHGLAALSREIARTGAEPLPVTMPLSHLVSAGQAQEIAPEVPPQTLEGIRSAFEQEAGVGQFDPADPEYESRWQLAQPTEADRMRSLYGWGAYSEFQRQAALAAAAAATLGK